MRRVILVVLSSLAVATTPATHAFGVGQTTATAQASTTVASKPGDYWFHGVGQSGLAVLTYGHDGCEAVDAKGFCTDGVWPTMDGARWIWHARNVSVRESIIGYTANFTRDFRLPATATGISGSIKINADDLFRLYLNGTFIGQGKHWDTPMMFPITPVPGLNEIRILVRNQSNPGGCFGPECNPGGVIYRADISYTA